MCKLVHRVLYVTSNQFPVQVDRQILNAECNLFVVDSISSYLLSSLSSLSSSLPHVLSISPFLSNTLFSYNALFFCCSPHLPKLNSKASKRSEITRTWPFGVNSIGWLEITFSLPKQEQRQALFIIFLT